MARGDSAKAKRGGLMQTGVESVVCLRASARSGAAVTSVGARRINNAKTA